MGKVLPAHVWDRPKSAGTLLPLKCTNCGLTRTPGPQRIIRNKAVWTYVYTRHGKTSANAKAFVCDSDFTTDPDPVQYRKHEWEEFLEGYDRCKRCGLLRKTIQQKKLPDGRMLRILRYYRGSTESSYARAFPCEDTVFDK